MNFNSGDDVKYLPGYRGWHSAVVTGYDAARGQYAIEPENGRELFAHEDELERA